MAKEISADLAASLRYAREQEDFWTGEVSKLKAQAIAEGGEEEELTVDGQTVFTNSFVSKFRTVEFRKEYPDVASYFTKTERREVSYLDEEGLKKARPDLYKKFQSRSFRFVD